MYTKLSVIKYDFLPTYKHLSMINVMITIDNHAILLFKNNDDNDIDSDCICLQLSTITDTMFY